MKLVKQTTLYLKDDRSDKVYEVDLCETPGGTFLVNFRYGRRGSNLREGTKTTSPVDRDSAEKLFDDLVASKTKKGYSESQSASSSEEPATAEVAQSQSEESDSRKRSILARLAKGDVRDKWPISRAVWRAGELRIEEAEPLIKDLVGDDEMLNYSIAWALAQIGLESSIPALEAIAQTKNRPRHLDHIVDEAIRICASERRREALISDRAAMFPASLKAAHESQDSQLFLKLLTEHLTSADLQAASVMNLVYFVDDEVVRPALLSVLQHVPFRVNYFRPLRRLFKAAELRCDAEVFGIIARRLELEPGTFSLSYWQKPRMAKALARDDAKFGFSTKTKHYLRNRVWRRLSQLGNDESEKYVSMAVGILLPFKDTDASFSPPTSTYSYNWQGDSGYIHREAMGSFWAFNQIVNQNNNRYGDKAVKGGFWLRMGLDAESPKTLATADSGAFPHLWKRQPRGLLHLLMESECEQVHDFAATLIRECPDFTKELDLDIIKQLLEKSYDSTLSLAVDLAVQQYDERNPDFDLVLTLCQCNLQKARELAFGWIAKDRRRFFADQAFAFAVLVSEHADTRKMAVDSISSMKSDRDFKEGLVARLLTFLVGLGTVERDPAQASETDAKSNGMLGDGIVDLNAPLPEENASPDLETGSNAALTESSEIADDVGKALLSSFFAHEIETLGEDVLCDLLASNVIEVQSMAAEAVLRHRDYKRQPTKRILSALLDATHPPVRAVGVRVLSELSHHVLTESVELIVQLTAHPLADIRAEIRPVANRLASRDQRFSRDYVAKLIDRLLTPGAPQGVPTHLSNVLREDYADSMEDVTADTVWQLLQSRSQPAQEVGGFLMPTHVKPESLKVIEIVKLANHDILTVRQAAWQMYESDVPRMEKSLVNAVRILDSKWDDSREFGFEYMRNRINPEVLTPASLISICDSVRPDVQQFGRELITREFTEEAGPEYLMKLSEHPTADLQLFVTNYLVDFGSDNIERLESLGPYFVSILSRVNKSRVAKDRVFSFLQSELHKSPEAAAIIAPILDRISATCAIGDKATTIELMLELREKYPDVELPIELKPVEAR